MQVIVTKDFAETASVVAEMILALVKEKPDCRLGLATGSTAEAVYPHIVDACKAGKADFSKTRSVNLDEYVGLSPEHPQSYRASMNRWLFDHINIDKKNTVVASGLGDPDEAVKAFNKAIDEGGRIDLQLLGVGIDGHVGFNEPGKCLYAAAHREKLTESTIEANKRFFESREEVPTEAITMGLGAIMKARKVVLAATGKNKADAMRQLLMTDEITPEMPCSMLKMHPNAVIVIDRALADEIGYKA